ncbi:MAG: polysaccharide deacetylase family protein [Bacteroidales bacterium]
MYLKIPKFIKKLYPSFIWSFPEEKNGIFLTFDDGPEPSVTPWILDQLAKYNAKATFFCLGRNVERNPELYKRILDEGHSVGNHSYSHVKGWRVDLDDYIDDIDYAANYVDSNLYRPPYARIKTKQARVINERYVTIMWNVLSFDYNKKLSGRQCANHVLPYLDPGNIIVFHDSIKSHKNMQYALPLVLQAIYDKGLVCKSIRIK